METPASLKRKVLSLQEKLGVLQAVEDKVPTAVILEQFGIAMSTFHRIKSQERDLKQKASTAKNLHCKRAKKSPYEQLNKALTEWYLERRLANDVIVGATVKNKARELAVSMGIDFVPSNGWLQRWKEKEKVSFHTPKDKKVSPNATEAKNWTNHVLLPILSEYDPQNVYCADETALYYAVDGSEHQFCWKLGFLCNRDGSDKQAFIQEPKTAPENAKNVSDRIRKDKLTFGEKWPLILNQLNRRFLEAKRQIVLFADVNALPIKASEPLTNIRCVYFPRNIKSLVNPLRHGVVQHLKAQFLQQVTRKKTASLEAGESVSEFCRQMALESVDEMLQAAVRALEAETVQRCFRKAGFEAGTSDKPVELVVDADCPTLTKAEFEEWMAVKQEAPEEASGNEDTVSEARNESKEPEKPSEEELPVEGSKCPEETDVKEALKTLREYYQHAIPDRTKFDVMESEVLCRLQKHVRN